MTVVSFLFAVTPALFWVWYFYRADKHPEPQKLVLKVFFLGIFSTVPVILVDFLVNSLELYWVMSALAYDFFVAFVLAGFCEEFIKFLVVKQFVYKNRQFDEIMDGIVYTVTASLGFACMENIIYVSGGNLKVAIARAVTAVPFHGFCSGIMGYYIGKAKFADSQEKERGLFRTGLIWAVGMHGIYDLAIFVSPLLGVFYSTVIVLIIYFLYKRLKGKIKTAIREDELANRSK